MNFEWYFESNICFENSPSESKYVSSKLQAVTQLHFAMQVKPKTEWCWRTVPAKISWDVAKLMQSHVGVLADIACLWGELSSRQKRKLQRLSPSSFTWDPISLLQFSHINIQDSVQNSLFQFLDREWWWRLRKACTWRTLINHSVSLIFVQFFIRNHETG